ncbi:MAG TPA: leucine--tRNA ligase, partial [Candidatus Gracilibacteria bacterium]|nr:leucine--tRNA ligase [Candidatus Gracilibacteria bacterium]
NSPEDKIRVYTTRPDTLFGCTYLVLSPEHALVQKCISESQRAEVEKYIAESLQKSERERKQTEKEKTGVFTGSYAINPVNDIAVPIWVADYVLADYGTGAIMAVPAHDERDFDFAKKFDLSIIPVIDGTRLANGMVLEGQNINSGFLNGLSTPAAKEKMLDFLEKKGVGERKVNYKLRDWIFTRQRYWGEPIPLVHCPYCGVVPLPESALPLTLPMTDNYLPTENGESPLAHLEDWVKTICPQCGKEARRETSTMPNWAGSSWYWLRYMDVQNTELPVGKSAEKYWQQVDLYVGGAEHAVLHLLYARFWHKFLYDLGIVSTKEPFQKLVNQGMILAYSHQNEFGKYYGYDEIEEKEGKFYAKEDNSLLITQIEKMSKSKYNVINPDGVVAEYGADTLRLYEMFMGPFEQTVVWDTKGVSGIRRFLDRVWRLQDNLDHSLNLADFPELRTLVHQTIKKVSEDTESFKFNTAISSLMVLVNALYQDEKVVPEAYQYLLQLLNPYAPHLTEEIWERLGNTDVLGEKAWPIYNDDFCQSETMKIMVQVNGKLRGELVVDLYAAQSDILKKAKELPNVQKLIPETGIRKEIYVPGKIVNLVI